MSLEKYIAGVLPIIKLCRNEGIIGPGRNRSYRGTRELYTRIFYGFVDYIDQDGRTYHVSRRAQNLYLAGKYHKTHPDKSFSSMKWIDQTKFDPGRKKFHLEHIYTGTMFTNAVMAMPESKLSVQGLAKLVRDNYRTAWILREENSRLPKSKRGDNISDALKVYAECGIDFE